MLRGHKVKVQDIKCRAREGIMLVTKRKRGVLRRVLYEAKEEDI